MCRSSDTHQVEEEDNYTHLINIVTNKDDIDNTGDSDCREDLVVSNKRMSTQIDTGAMQSLMPYYQCHLYSNHELHTKDDEA